LYECEFEIAIETKGALPLFRRDQPKGALTYLILLGGGKIRTWDPAPRRWRAYGSLKLMELGGNFSYKSIYSGFLEWPKNGRNRLILLVGPPGFEPGTSCTPST
jgi:hypothetical protein